MSDLGNSNWSETAASNNASPPNGWPEGMNPSDVNNSARENMAALKRLYDRQNLVLTTGGTSTAYTLTNTVAQAAYYAGERASFIVNATCDAAPTLNIDGLGAFNIRKFTGGAFANLAAGDIVANQPLEVYYNSSATTFDIITQVPQTVWQAIGTSLPSASGSVSFQSIPTSINILQVIFNLTFSTNNSSIGLQFYNSAGTLDSGSTSYYYSAAAANSNATGGAAGASTNNCVVLGSGINNDAARGFSGDAIIANIQAVKATQCNFRTNWLDQGGTFFTNWAGGGARVANGNITGIKLFPAAGTFTGRITLFASTN